MNRAILIITALLSFLSLTAQESYIISSHFDPDTCFTILYHGTYSDTTQIDLNEDGTGDVFIYLEPHMAGGLMIYLSCAPQWQWSDYYLIDQTHYQYLSDTAIICDTICWQNSYSFMDPHDIEPTDGGWHYAFRHQSEDGVHYGWAYIYKEAYMRVCISGYGYCTIPDQPILWGQTELLNVEESGVTAFTIVHPNPTTGLITITGKDLKQAEVFNTLGQRVAMAQGEGERMTVDISALPAGIYFVNVTNSEGRKCVQKIVKE